MACGEASVSCAGWRSSALDILKYRFCIGLWHKGSPMGIVPGSFLLDNSWLETSGVTGYTVPGHPSGPTPVQWVSLR